MTCYFNTNNNLIRSHCDSTVEAALSALGATEILRVGGAGHKVLFFFNFAENISIGGLFKMLSFTCTGYVTYGRKSPCLRFRK